MIVFDGDYSVTIHMELNEEQALERGGVNLDQTKENINLLTDWILAAISENIELNDTDFVVVMPYERKLTVDGVEEPLPDDVVFGYAENADEEDEESNVTFSTDANDESDNIK